MVAEFPSAEHLCLVQLFCFSFDPYGSEATKLLQTPLFLTAPAIATIYVCSNFIGMPWKSRTWLRTFLHSEFQIFTVSSRKRLTLLRNSFLRQPFERTAWLAFWGLGSAQIPFSQAGKTYSEKGLFSEWRSLDGFIVNVRDMVICHLPFHILI